MPLSHSMGSFLFGDTGSRRSNTGSKSDDSYRDGDADPRDTFHNCKKIRGSKSDDSYRDGDANPRDPCDC